MSDMPLPAEPGSEQKSLVDVGKKSARYASYVFWVMFSINFFNYFDRYILPSALDPIAKDLHLNPAGVGLLPSAFLTVYAIFALPLGFWADRGIRKNVIALGVGIWSLFTFLSGFAFNLASLFLTRAFVGIGEAGYYPAGTSLLSDYFPSAKRAQILARWTAGSLIGLALGFVAGGVIAGISAHSWRFAFFIAGIPGLFFTYLAYRLREPARGHADGWVKDDQPAKSTPPTGPKVSLGRAFKELLSIRTIVVIILIHIMGFWVLGAASNWLPVYLTLKFGIGTANAGIISGGVLVFAGILGALLGGWLADLFTRRWTSGRVLAGSLGFLVSAPLIALALLSEEFLLFLPFFFLTGMLLNVYSGPLSAVLQDIVRPELRAMSVAISLLIGHLLGDATSSFQVGLIINKLANLPLFDFSNQSANGLESIPHIAQLTSNAMLMTMPLLLALAGLIGLIGSRFVGHDLQTVEAKRQERLQTPA